MIFRNVASNSPAGPCRLRSASTKARTVGAGGRAAPGRRKGGRPSADSRDACAGSGGEEYPARGPAIREASDAAERAAQEDGTLTAEKKASIEASRKGADLKDLQAQKAEILAGKFCALANSDRDRLDGLER